jgi:hypothetical protein
MNQLSIAQIAMRKLRKSILRLELFLKALVSTKQILRQSLQENLIN